MAVLPRCCSRKGGRPMTEMEPFPFFYQEDATGSTAAATSAAMEELLSPWDSFRGLSDVVTPAFDLSPLPSDEDVLLWGGDYDLPASLISLPPPPPLPPVPAPGAEMLQYYALPPETQPLPRAPAPPPLDQIPPPARGVRRSAFVGYESWRRYGGCRRPSTGEGNIHRRVLECLRRMPAEEEERKAAEGSRCFRHMMRERRRRERLSQSYADLHSMIVPRPKANKNAIVLSAAAYVRELKSTRDALQRRHQELRASLGERGASDAGGRAPEGGTTVKVRIGNPTSAVDSMIAALRQLKGMGVRARSIRSCADGKELSAVVDVETKKGGGDGRGGSPGGSGPESAWKRFGPYER